MSQVPADPHVAGVARAGEGRDGTLTTADGVPLKIALGRAQSRARRRAFLLVVPLLVFLLVTFVSPIGQMLHRAVYNPVFPDNMPLLTSWFDPNPRGSKVDESGYTALAKDLKVLQKDYTAGLVGTRVNYEISGTRSLFTSRARCVQVESERML